VSREPRPPPVARRGDKKLAVHGHVREDPYYWLRDDDRKDGEVLAYLADENAYTNDLLAHTKSVQQTLLDEIVARIKQDDDSVPALVDGYWHYRRYREGGEHPVYCRRKGALDAPEEVLLDANAEAEPHEYYAAASVKTTRRGDRLAWAEDTLGRRIYDIRIEDLVANERFEEVIPETSGNLTWANDSETLFYVRREPATLRAYQLWRHRVGNDPASDVLVYQEEDETFSVYVYRTKSNRFIVLHSSSTLTDEARFVSADAPEDELRVFLARERGHEYGIMHAGDRFYVRTNWNARNFRLMAAAEDRTQDRDAWQEVIPHRGDVLLESTEVFQDFLVVRERSEALTRLRVIPWSDPASAHEVAFEEPAYATWIDDNPAYDTHVLRFGYTSLTTPATIYDYDMKTRTRERKKREEVLGGFDPEAYETKRMWAPARDGARIPVSLVRRKDLDRTQPQPMYLYAYGSYGMSTEPGFAAARLSLLDRGIVFAIAHVRGGSEMGRSWYDDGKLMAKRNTFTDFIDATRYLQDQEWTSADKTVAMGGSAGGLLMGAIANMAPERYRAIVAHVPFVDVVTTMLDESIPLTTFEYDEWGNPNVKEAYDYMLSYSPYDNVCAQDYPAILVLTGLHDSQVQYWEPAKWVARLRSRKTDSNPLLLHTNMDAGHGGASGRFKRHRETALEYAFVLDILERLSPGPDLH
jgi:oligopeptidase B